MSVTGMLGGNTEPEKPKLTPEQQKVYDERTKKLTEGIDQANKIKKENIEKYPQIFTQQYSSIFDTAIKEAIRINEENAALTDEELNKKLGVGFTLFEKNPIFGNAYFAYLNGMKLLFLLKILPSFLRTNADELLIEKKITEAQKKKIDDIATKFQTYYDSINNTTPLMGVFENYDKLYAEINQVYKELKIPNPIDSIRWRSEDEKDIKALIALDKQVKQQEKKVAEVKTAERDTFSMKRLFSETLSITGTVIASLSFVMLFLVSGMLCANDAIGRDYRYRILYFFYGGLGFPFMLLYYLFRWFTGSAPHIYRLLPIFTEESDTNLGRFFLFPFTYKEDEGAKKAQISFMEQAAKLVGKTYAAPGSTGEEAAGKALKLASALQGLQIETAPLSSLPTIANKIKNLPLMTA